MNKKEIKAYCEAYDSLYNLNSLSSYKFNDLLERLEAEVKEKGFKFKLNDRSQKFKLVVE